MMKIWERYFLRHFFGMFFFFLFCFYGLYVMVDYASHTHAFSSAHIQIPLVEIARYYLFVFSSRSEILIPLALLIAFVKTTSSLNANQELVALMAGGFRLKLLMRPFLFCGIAAVLMLYANEEFLKPAALKRLRLLEEATKHQKKRNLPEIAVKHLLLEDGSLLLFQDFELSNGRFFDVFWIESPDSIYKIKYLSPISEIPVGFIVDHLRRQPDGDLIQEAAYEELSFPAMKFNQEILQSAILEPDILSLTSLAAEAAQAPLSDLSEKESKIMTAFYWKLTLPWLALLAIIAPAPFCVKFSRQTPLFFIYMSALFGLIAFYMFMDAAQVVAKRQVIPPFWAICGPFLIVTAYFGWRFHKIEAARS